MPTTLRNTDILFNDGSTQSTAYPGVYTGTVANNTSYPVGTDIFIAATRTAIAATFTVQVENSPSFASEFRVGATGSYINLAGTWRNRGNVNGTYASGMLAQRTA